MDFSAYLFVIYYKNTINKRAHLYKVDFLKKHKIGNK